MVFRRIINRLLFIIDGFPLSIDPDTMDKRSADIKASGGEGGRPEMGRWGSIVAWILCQMRPGQILVGRPYSNPRGLRQGHWGQSSVNLNHGSPNAWGSRYGNGIITNILSRTRKISIAPAGIWNPIRAIGWSTRIIRRGGRMDARDGEGDPMWAEVGSVMVKMKEGRPDVGGWGSIVAWILCQMRPG
jgi:hypothetical protein